MSTTGPRRSSSTIRRLRRGGLVLAATTLSLTTLSVPAAHADTATTVLQFAGSHILQQRHYDVGCDTCIPGDSGLGTRIDVNISADWSPTATVAHSYTPALVRQGETLDLTNTLTPGSGPLTVHYGISGDAGVFNFTGSGAQFPAAGSASSVATFALSDIATSTCALKLDGDGSYDCSATKTYTLYEATFLGNGYKITLPITTHLTITPDGVISVRSVVVGTSPVLGPDLLAFHGPSPAVVPDNFQVPCTAPAGSNLRYDLASSSTNPVSVASTTAAVSLVLETTFFNTTLGTVTLATLGPDTTTFGLTAPSYQVQLGTISADNKPPVVTSPADYSGTEGSPVTLTAAGTTDNCADTLTYRWELSDGGTAFGISPQHTFTDNGTYSGQLTVTDAAGNASTKAFRAVITNVAPTANAGPDTSAAWGRDVAFSGTGTDPGSADQGTLTYSWSFGDGTPSASGGPSTTHAYATPGSYTATMTVCDKDGACSSSNRIVTVRTRSVQVGYLGDHNATYDTLATFSGSLVDQFGQPVPGRLLSFTTGPEDEGSVSTGSAGTATRSSRVGLGAGSYPVSVSYLGDSLYAGATDTSASMSVVRKGSQQAYTGATTGGPNKVVLLSAVLKDADGRPLSGRTVAFTLGTQTASATSDANGLAATRLTLNQKNGTYSVTSSWAPSGSDAVRYVGSATSSTFKLQAR